MPMIRSGSPTSRRRAEPLRSSRESQKKLSAQQGNSVRNSSCVSSPIAVANAAMSGPRLDRAARAASSPASVKVQSSTKSEKNHA